MCRAALNAKQLLFEKVTFVKMPWRGNLVQTGWANGRSAVQVNGSAWFFTVESNALLGEMLVGFRHPLLSYAADSHMDSICLALVHI